MKNMVVETKVISGWSVIILTLSGILTFLGISHLSFYLMSVFVIIDISTGFIKGLVHKNLKSRSLLAGIISKVLFLSIPLLFALFGKLNGYNMTYIVSTIFFLMSAGELYSIIGNIYEIKTGKKQKEIDAIDKLYKFLLKSIRGVIDKELEKKEILIDKDN